MFKPAIIMSGSLRTRCHQWWSTAEDRAYDDEEVMDSSRNEYVEQCIRQMRSTNLLTAVEKGTVALEDVLAFPLDWSEVLQEVHVGQQSRNYLGLTLDLESRNYHRQASVSSDCAASSSSTLSAMPDLVPSPSYNNWQSSPNTSMPATPVLSKSEMANDNMPNKRVRRTPSLSTILQLPTEYFQPPSNDYASDQMLALLGR